MCRPSAPLSDRYLPNLVGPASQLLGWRLHIRNRDLAGSAPRDADSSGDVVSNDCSLDGGNCSSCPIAAPPVCRAVFSGDNNSPHRRCIKLAKSALFIFVSAKDRPFDRGRMPRRHVVACWSRDSGRDSIQIRSGRVDHYCFFVDCHCVCGALPSLNGAGLLTTRIFLSIFVLAVMYGRITSKPLTSRERSAVVE